MSISHCVCMTSEATCALIDFCFFHCCSLDCINLLCRVFVHGRFTDAIDVFNETTIERARVVRNYDPSPLATIEVNNCKAVKLRIMHSRTHAL